MKRELLNAVFGDEMALTKAKAKKILKDGSVRGKKLTAKQKRKFGAIAGGQKERKR